MTLAPAAPAALAHCVRRPDPALGVFETLLVVDGEAQRLNAHLARLAGSLTELYGRALPPDLEARARALARTARGPARLRIDVVPLADAELSLAPVRQRELPIVLHPYTLPGGLGAHKWRDRTLLDALRQTPLLMDADGTVLEAGWANLLIRRGGALLRPRADGRILAGTSLPDAEETDLTLADLRRADEILVSSSIAGVVPAVLAGRPRSPDGISETAAGYRAVMADRQAWDLAFDPATGRRLTQQEVGNRNLLPSGRWPSFFSRVAARLQWDANAIDLAPDARAWPELPDERRERLTAILAGFRVAEDAVAEHIAPFGEAANNSLVAWVLYLQRRDEQRHAVMFDRIAAEVLKLPGDSPDERLDAARKHAPSGVLELFEERLPAVAGELAAGRAGIDAGIGLYHMILEGIVLLSGQRALLADLVAGGLPGVREGVQRVERDERWHIGFGLRLLIDAQPAPQVIDDVLASAEDAAGAWGDAVPKEIRDAVVPMCRRRLAVAKLIGAGATA